MPLYHCSVSVIKRSEGRSAVAAAAYRAGEKIKNERDGITHDYRKKSGVIHREIILPKGAPEVFHKRNVLWNAAEKAEKRKDGQPAREVRIGLQREFSLSENVAVLREYIDENFVREGMCADFVIHDKNDGNPHAHILLTRREVDENGFFERKTGKSRDEWDSKKSLGKWRESWTKVCNREFERKGLAQRVDHRTLEEQGIERIPTIHLGKAAEQMEKSGKVSERMSRYREIKEENRQIEKLEKEIEALARMKADVESGEEKTKNDGGLTFDTDHDLVRRQRDIEAKREERRERPFYDVIGRWMLDREIKRLEREKRKEMRVVVREERQRAQDEAENSSTAVISEEEKTHERTAPKYISNEEAQKIIDDINAKYGKNRQEFNTMTREVHQKSRDHAPKKHLSQEEAQKIIDNINVRHAVKRSNIIQEVEKSRNSGPPKYLSNDESQKIIDEINARHHERLKVVPPPELDRSKKRDHD